MPDIGIYEGLYNYRIRASGVNGHVWNYLPIGPVRSCRRCGIWLFYETSRAGLGRLSRDGRRCHGAKPGKHLRKYGLMPVGFRLPRRSSLPGGHDV